MLKRDLERMMVLKNRELREGRQKIRKLKGLIAVLMRDKGYMNIANELDIPHSEAKRIFKIAMERIELCRTIEKL